MVLVDHPQVVPVVDGRFTLAGLQSGSHDVVAASAGLLSDRVTGTVTQDGTTELPRDLCLLPVSGVMQPLSGSVVVAANNRGLVVRHPAAVCGRR